MLQASVEAWTQQVVQERLRFTEAVQLTTAQEKVEHWSSGVRNTALGTELYIAVAKIFAQVLFLLDLVL